MRKFLFLLLMFFTLNIFGQDQFLIKPKTNDDKILSLLSPTASVDGFSGLSKYSAISAFFNPASNSLKNQISFDGVFGLIFGYSTDYSPEESEVSLEAKTKNFGYNGGAAITIPSLYGSFGVGALAMYSQAKDFYVRPTGLFSFTYSNTILQNLAIGGGVKALLSENKFKEKIFSIGGDVGIIWAPENVKYVENLYFEASLNNMGYGTTVDDDSAYGLSFFTLNTGVSFSFFKNEYVDLNYFTHLSLPTFQNLIVTPGFDFNVKNIFSFKVSTTLNALELKNKDASNLIPAFGIYVNINTSPKDDDNYPYTINNKLDLSTKSFKPSLWNLNFGWSIQGGKSVDVLSYDDKAFLDINLDEARELSTDLIIEPEKLLLTMKEKERVILIPGSQVRLGTLPIDIRFLTKKFFKNITLIVEDSDNNIVHKALLDQTLKTKFSNDTSNIRTYWDGYNLQKEISPMGIYTVYVKALDESNNNFLSKRVKFYLNKDLSFIKLFLNDIFDSIFSTDIWGKNSDITIEEISSIESRWDWEISNEFLGVVKSGSFINSEALNLTWDGKTNNSIKVPDGVYNYKIWTTTKAGNHLEAEFESIVVDNDYDSLKLNIINGILSKKEGEQRPIQFSIYNEHLNNISWWKLEILDNEGKVYFSKKINGVVPELIEYKNTNNRNNRSLKAGKYRGRVIISYENGNIKTGISDEFEMTN